MGMDFSPLPNCGEAWVLSGVEGNPSIVSNGYLAGNELNELLEVYMYDLVGDEVYEQFGNEFPVLIKLIDANDWFRFRFIPMMNWPPNARSVEEKQKCGMYWEQMRMHRLISGFNQKLNQQSYLKHLENKASQIS